MNALVFICGFCIVAVLVYMARYSGRVRVEAVRLIDAPLDQVYAKVADFAQWQQWNPWLAPGTQASRTISDSGDQPGSTCAWESGGTGSGSVQHVRLLKEQRIEQRVRLRHPFVVSGRSKWFFARVGDKTEVRWSLRGRVAFTMRAFAATVQGSLALDCRYGLDQLAHLLEPAEAPRYGIVHLGVREVESRHYVYDVYQGPINALAQAVRTTVAELRQDLASRGVQAAGAPIAVYFKTNIKLRTTMCHIGLPIHRAEDAGTLLARELPAHRAYAVRLEGDPSAVEVAWYHGMQRMVADKIKPDQRTPPFESYLVSGEEANACVTELYVPVL